MLYDLQIASCLFLRISSLFPHFFTIPVLLMNSLSISLIFLFLSLFYSYSATLSYLLFCYYTHTLLYPTTSVPVTLLYRIPGIGWSYFGADPDWSEKQVGDERWRVLVNLFVGSEFALVDLLIVGSTRLKILPFNKRTKNYLRKNKCLYLSFPKLSSIFLIFILPYFSFSSSFPH